MAPKKSATAGAKAKPAGAGATPPKADAKKVDAAKKSARSPAPAPREEPFGTATPTILLLGAYGTVGSAIARTVLAQSSTAKLIIAGRDSDKARYCTKALNAEYPSATGGERCSMVVADASDSSTLNGCPRFDVIVNATTMRAVEGVITLMRFAASKRAHYIDLRSVIGLEEAIARAVGDVGPVVLMGGGYCPGAVAPLLKTAATKLATCTAAHLSIAATALPSQAEEAVEAMMSGVRLEDWRNGKWQPAKPSQPTFARKVDFGDGKARHTTPVGVQEVRELPTQLALDQCSVRFASTQDGGLMCAAMAVLCCAPCVEAAGGRGEASARGDGAPARQGAAALRVHLRGDRRR